MVEMVLTQRKKSQSFFMLRGGSRGRAAMVSAVAVV